MRLAAAAAVMILSSAQLAMADTAAAINANCEKEWGENYRMQRYCREKQYGAASEFDKILSATENDKVRYKILQTCVSEWPEGDTSNWRMVVYCYKKQSEAYDALNR